MLDRKPALPANVNPKHVALRFFFKDALVQRGPKKFTEYEEIVKHDQLYGRGNVELACGAKAKVPIKITYKNGFLLVRTSGAVDVHITGDIPASAIHVETKGDCLFFNGSFIKHNLKLYVTAKIIAIDIPIPDAKFIALLPNKKTKAVVWIRDDVATDKLILDANELQLDAKLKTGKGLISCKQLRPSKYSELTITGQSSNETKGRVLSFSVMPHPFDELHKSLIETIDRTPKSVLAISEDTRFAGTLNLVMTKFSSASKIKFTPESKTNLCSVELAAKSLDVAEQANVSGNKTTCMLLDDAQIDGHVVIDDFIISAKNVDVSKKGILDGVSRLIIEQKRYLTVTGEARSADTYIDGELALASFGGIISGSQSLTLRCMTSGALFGGCIASPKMHYKSAFSLHLFGILSGWSMPLDSMTSLEFGNVYIPYVDFSLNRQEVYDVLCGKLKGLKDLPNKSRKDLYKDLYDLVPKTTDEAWQSVASKSGIIRTILSTVSTPASVVFSFSYQTVATIKQLIYLHNAYQSSSSTGFNDNPTAKEMLLMLLDLKSMLVSGNAFKQSSIAGFSSQARRASASVVAADLASLYLPVVQNDTVFGMSVPLLSLSWNETCQNVFSWRAGNVVAWNQYEQTMRDQHDHSRRIAHNMVLSCDGTRYHNCKTTTVYSSISARRLVYNGNDHSQRASFEVKEMPIAEASDMYHGRGKFKKLVAKKSIHVATEAEGEIDVGKSERGPNVAHSLRIPGAISVVEELIGSGIALQSTASSIYQRKDIHTEDAAALIAKKDVVRPGVTTQSAKGDVFVQAGGLVDNSQGAKLIAYGIAHVTGSTVHNVTTDPRKPSEISGRRTFVHATAGDVINLGGMIRGWEFVKVSAAGNVLNVALRIRTWGTCDYIVTFNPAEILGGSGVDFAAEYATVVIAEGKVDNYGSTIGSAGHTLVLGKLEVNHVTEHNTSKVVDKKRRSGTNTYYITGSGAQWGPANVFGLKITIGSSEGIVYIHGANVMAPHGTTVWSKGQHINESAVVNLWQKEVKVRAKGAFGKRKHTEDHQHEVVAVFQTESGDIKIISLEAGIKSLGAAYLGSSGAKPKLFFLARGDISVLPRVLDHIIRHREYGKLNLSIAGQNILGGARQMRFGDRVAALDQSVASSLDLLRSTHPLDVAVNGYSAIGGLSNLAESIAKHGIAGTVAMRSGVSVGVTNSKTTSKYQTRGIAVILHFDEVVMKSETGNVLLGSDVDHVKKLLVHAKVFTIQGTELRSSFRYNAQTLTGTMSFVGSGDISAAVSFAETVNRNFAQTKVRVDVAEVYADTMDVAGADIDCKVARGKVGRLITRPLIGTSSSKSGSVSVGLAGNVNVSVGSGRQQTYDARGSFKADDSSQFTVKERIESRDEFLRSKQVGYSIGAKPTAIGDPKASHTLQVGFTKQASLVRASEHGTKVVSRQRRNANFVHYVIPQRDVPGHHKEHHVPAETSSEHGLRTPTPVTAKATRVGVVSTGLAKERGSLSESKSSVVEHKPRLTRERQDPSTSHKPVFPGKSEPSLVLDGGSGQPILSSAKTSYRTKPIVTPNLEAGLGAKLLIGSGRSFVALGQGVKQLGLGVGEKVGIVQPGATAKYTGQINREKKFYDRTPVGKSKVAKASEIATDLAVTFVVPMGSGAKGVRLIFSSAGAGAVFSGVQATESGSLAQRGVNAAIGGVVGAACPIILGAPSAGMWMYRQHRIGRSLGANPFKGKAFPQIGVRLEGRGFTTKGSDPVSGRGSYFHPKTGRKYYLDPADREVAKKGLQRETPHVDVHHKVGGENIDKKHQIPSNVPWSAAKRKYPLGDRLYEPISPSPGSG